MTPPSPCGEGGGGGRKDSDKELLGSTKSYLQHIKIMLHTLPGYKTGVQSMINLFINVSW